jgi:hypothetical protein
MKADIPAIRQLAKVVASKAEVLIGELLAKYVATTEPQARLRLRAEVEKAIQTKQDAVAILEKTQ